MKTMKFLLVLGVLAVLGGVVLWDRMDRSTVRSVAQGTPQVVTEAIRPLLGTEAFTVVHFWALWCPTCMSEMPEMLAAAKKGSSNVKLAMVNEDHKPAQVAEFYTRNGIADGPHVVWSDDPGAAMVASVVKTKALMLPMTLVYDRSGTLIQRLDGRVDWESMLSTLVRHAENPPVPGAF